MPTMSAGAVLAGLPASIRDELVCALSKITTSYREGRWEPAELNAGKLCEIVYTIIRGQADGTIPNKPTKPKNMVDACKDLEKESHLPRSLRIQVPRMLVALYEIRNNRGVGHAGGDVDPSNMDAIAVLYMSKWLVAELVRVFHAVTTHEASEAVDLLVEREVPAVWAVDGKKRVLAQKLSQRDKTILLLYSEPGAVAESDLRKWVEAANPSAYRRDVLRKAHKQKFLEYDDVAQTVRLSPTGIRYAENKLPLAI